MKSKQDELFRDAPVWKAIFSLAGPSLVSMLVMMLYNMADMYFIGQTGHVEMMAAVSMSSPVYTLVMAMGAMLGGGGCVLVAQALGAGDTSRVKRLSSICGWGSLAAGGIIALGVTFCAANLPFWLGCTQETAAYCREYVLIISCGAPLMVFSTTYARLLTAAGAVRQGVIANAIGTVLNIVLDPLFIHVLEMGVRGAAAATITGNAVTALYLLIHLRRRNTTLSMDIRLIPKCLKELGAVLALGLPNGVNSVLAGTSSTIANRLLAPYGVQAVAAMASAGKATLIVSMVQMGVCIGVQPLMAYQVGRKNHARLRECLQKLTTLTVSLGLAAMLLCLTCSEQIVSLFLKDQEIVSLSSCMLRLMAFSGPFLGGYYIASSFLQSMGCASQATLVSTLRQGIFLIPMIYIMNALLGMMGNAAAHLAADGLAATVAVLLCLCQYRSQFCSIGKGTGDE